MQRKQAVSNVAPINSAGQARGGTANQLRKTALPGRTYSKSSYYPSTGGDANGHRSQQRVNLPRNLDDAIKILAAVDENYLHSHDVIRDAIVHLIMRRADEMQVSGQIEVSEEMREKVELQIKMDRQLEIREVRELQKEYLRNIQDNVAIAVETVDHDLMDELYEIADDQVNDETLPWGVRQEWEELHEHLTKSIREATARIGK